MKNLKVTPIYGSHGHHPYCKSFSLPPVCTLIEYGGKRVLVDMGMDEGIKVDDILIDKMRNEILPSVDIVLVCNSTLSSIGGLPIFLKKKDNKKHSQQQQLDASTKKDDTNESSDQKHNLPYVYGTFPTCKMGQMTLYDTHANICLDGGNAGYDLDDVDFVFSTERFQTLKYAQSITLKEGHHDQSNGPPHLHTKNDSASSIEKKKIRKNRDVLSITPHRAGNVTGGCFWILRRVQDETEVVVAPLYHHSKEKHLDASTLYKYGSTADVLITRPGGPGGLLGNLYSYHASRPIYFSSERKKPILQYPLVARSEGELIEVVMAALRRGGNVLLPTDASGRVLELLLLFSQYWDKNRLASTYNLCWVGPMSCNVIDYARSQLEWMASPLGQQFDSQRGHPYALKSVHMCSSVSELEAIEEQNQLPMAVFASGASLEHGPARDLLLKYADNPDNAIILTDSQRCVPRLQHEAAGLVEDKKEPDVKSTQGNVDMKKSLSDKLDVSRRISSDTTTSNPKTVSDSSNNVTHAENTLSTSAQLLLKWCEAKKTHKEMADVIEVDVPVPHREPLKGQELEVFLAEEEATRLRKKAQEERKALLREVELARGQLRLGDEDDTVEEAVTNNSTSNNNVQQNSSGNSSKLDENNKKRASEGKTFSSKKKKSRFNQNLFIKFSKPVHMTFDVCEEAAGIGQKDSIAKFGVQESVGRDRVLQDDYGISIIPEKFIDIVTGIDPSKIGSSGRIGENDLLLMRGRGLGFGSDGRPVLSSLDKTGTSKSKNDIDDKDMNATLLDEAGEFDEQALEAADLSEGKGIIRGRNGKEHVKVTTRIESLEVLAEINFVPIEGRVDARAARQTVRSLQPRQVVIIGNGTPPSYLINKEDEDGLNDSIVGEADLLANAVRELTIKVGDKENSDESIFMPENGQTVTLDVGHAAYSARLINTIYVSREERERRAIVRREREENGMDEDEDSDNAEEPVSYEPHEEKMGDCVVSYMDCVATGQKVAADGSIVLAPRASTLEVNSSGNKNTTRHKGNNIMLSDGDVYLTDLRSEIIAQGMKAEYSAHSGYQQLIVNSTIIIRKDQSTGKISLEGPLCEAFYLVRSVVCSQFVTL